MTPRVGIYPFSLTHILSVCLFVCTFFALPVDAQVGISGQQLSLVSIPSFPKPSETVTVRINDYSVNAVGAEIFWFIDGEEQTDLKNERSVQITTGNIGEDTVVRAVLVRTNATQLETAITITPSVVDLIIEADTYTPSFYAGRALPSRAAQVRAIAVVHDGTITNTDAYTYRWTLGQDVLNQGPVRGKNVVTFTLPLYSTDLEVEVLNEAGKPVGKAATTLEAVQPELYFYEWSPLRGLFQRAITYPLPLIGTETVVYGEPYFVQQAPSGASATFSWTLGGTPLSSTDAPHAIELMRDAIPQNTTVRLRAMTNDRVPQVLEDTFEVVPMN